MSGVVGEGRSAGGEGGSHHVVLSLRHPSSRERALIGKRSPTLQKGTGNFRQSTVKTCGRVPDERKSSPKGEEKSDDPCAHRPKLETARVESSWLRGGITCHSEEPQGQGEREADNYAFKKKGNRKEEEGSISH